MVEISMGYQCYKTFFYLTVKLWHNKLKCLSLASIPTKSSVCSCCQEQTPENYFTLISSYSFSVKMRQELKYLSMTNTLAYYADALTETKVFTALAHVQFFFSFIKVRWRYCVKSFFSCQIVLSQCGWETSCNAA
jgi:hypothetical protein